MNKLSLNASRRPFDLVVCDTILGMCAYAQENIQNMQVNSFFLDVGDFLVETSHFPPNSLP